MLFRSMYEWLAARPEIDPERIGISGRSFGSFFVTIAMAGEPRYRAGVVSGTIHEPGCRSIFEEAPPTFKRRFMYMAGYRDEAEFDRFAKTLTWEGHAQNIRAPYLCITGEFDALSPLRYTEDLFRALAGPKVLVIYQGAGHAVSAVPSANLGPYFPTLMTDWLAARLSGKPLASERWWVDANGNVTLAGSSTAYFLQAPGPAQTCASGLPLTYQNVGVYRIGAGGTFNLTTWQGTGGTSYVVSANAGVLSSTQAHGDIY